MRVDFFVYMDFAKADFVLVEWPGFEPGASCVRDTRSTADLPPHWLRGYFGGGIFVLPFVVNLMVSMLCIRFRSSA